MADGEKSGFILSRRPEEENKLKAIPELDITFEYVRSHGSAIVMRNSQYRLHKTLAAVRRNLLKIFPLIDADFRIHIIRGGEAEVVEDFDKNVMAELGALITLGKEFSSLSDQVPDLYPERRADLVATQDTKSIPLVMEDNQGAKHEYSLDISGWIGTYKTTRGRKAVMTDFPDNFISLFANKKMGEFNCESQ